MRISTPWIAAVLCLFPVPSAAYLSPEEVFGIEVPEAAAEENGEPSVAPDDTADDTALPHPAATSTGDTATVNTATSTAAVTSEDAAVATGTRPLYRGGKRIDIPVSQPGAETQETAEGETTETLQDDEAASASGATGAMEENSFAAGSGAMQFLKELEEAERAAEEEEKNDEQPPEESGSGALATDDRGSDDTSVAREESRGFGAAFGDIVFGIGGAIVAVILGVLLLVFKGHKRSAPQEMAAPATAQAAPQAPAAAPGESKLQQAIDDMRQKNQS